MVSDASDTSYSNVIYISCESENGMDGHWYLERSGPEVEQLATSDQTQVSSPLVTAGRCGISDELCQHYLLTDQTHPDKKISSHLFPRVHPTSKDITPPTRETLE